MRILGVDPGLAKMGWGIIEFKGNRLIHIANGTVRTQPKQRMSDRLARIYAELVQLITLWQPDEVAVEETFVNKHNPQDALKLGQARGVALCAPATMGLSVSEYAANKIKKTVVGTGHADKKQVQMMIKTLMPLAEVHSADAADALAIAICHAHHAQSYTAMPLAE